MLFKVFVSVFALYSRVTLYAFTILVCYNREPELSLDVYGITENTENSF